MAATVKRIRGHTPVLLLTGLQSEGRLPADVGSCDVYLEARKQRDVVYLGASAEFTRWLGGYLSGVNATSLSTDNVLGKAELADAVSWLEEYCRAHPLTSFAGAVEVLVAADHPLDTDRRAVSR